MLSSTTTATPTAPAAPAAAPTKNSNSCTARSNLANTNDDPIFPPDLPTTDPAAASAWPLLVADSARLQHAVERYAQHAAHADAAARSATARAEAAERALAVVAYRLETAVVPTAEARVRVVETERDALARRVRQLEAALMSTEVAFVRALEDARHWCACERVVPVPVRVEEKYERDVPAPVLKAEKMRARRGRSRRSTSKVAMAEREMVQAAMGAVEEPAPDMDVTRLNAVIEGHFRSLDHDDGEEDEEEEDVSVSPPTNGRAARPAITAESARKH
ncbi:hypothetical protein AMAG_07258 [Allomyces macrogynus ATCC 38327]|uniref:Uncharacterized protein n=1 Tax=Allomyces macrogynus (strain ATCC 38327) TaxID=578462 RepID=A0A0L0SHM2_ALLM3|nr:hypothetical protein AMAG_07258 [Allomyces macrogynus ATCC 38327]|eukprot:KNE61998.1 hypothetical protein AMAG_07258 [Allomyces macrogynus ATCC 38327]